MTEQEKREKVIEGLENIAEFFKARGDMAVGDGKMLLLSWMRVAEDALALLKAQEPRVITLEEILYMLKKPFWKECKSGNKALYTGWALAYDIKTGVGITGTRLGMAEPSGRVVWYKLDDYGKTWRCWTSEPTEAEREAIPWENRLMQTS